MPSSKVSVRMDEALKKQLEAVFENIGMNMTTGINVLAKGIVRRGGIPSELVNDPFYSEANQKRLHNSMEQLEKGQVITKTMEELEAMENKTIHE